MGNQSTHQKVISPSLPTASSEHTTFISNKGPEPSLKTTNSVNQNVMMKVEVDQIIEDCNQNQSRMIDMVVENNKKNIVASKKVIQDKENLLNHRKSSQEHDHFQQVERKTSQGTQLLNHSQVQNCQQDNHLSIKVISKCEDLKTVEPGLSEKSVLVEDIDNFNYESQAKPHQKLKSVRVSKINLHGN